MTKNTKYLDTVINMFPILGNCIKYGSEYINERRLNINNLFWRDVLNCYKKFADKIEPSNSIELLSSPLWFNKHIKVGGRAVRYANWESKGISYLNDLIGPNCELLSFEMFQRKFQLQNRVNFLQYEVFIRSVRNFIIRYAVLSENNEQIQGPLLSFGCSLMLKCNKGCRFIYDKLILDNITPASVIKWQAELDFNRGLNWKMLFYLPFQISKDASIRWFQTRINHRTLGTNYLLYKMKIKGMDKCTFCERHTETLTHLFWECEHVQYFWETFQIILKDNCGLDLNLTVNDIIFGNTKYDYILNLLLIYAKKSIYKMKIQGKLPSYNLFVYDITNLYRVDARINQQRKQFEEKWENYKKLLNIDL